jgi:hypothetical protein
MLEGAACDAGIAADRDSLAAAAAFTAVSFGTTGDVTWRSANNKATTPTVAAMSAKAGYFNLANFIVMVLSRAWPTLLVNSSNGSCQF